MGPGENAFDIDGLRQLQREARRIAAGLAQATDPQSRVDGWDGTHTVRVTVDGSGRVAETEVGSSWRAALRPADLGAAVIEAVRAAEAERMAGWARATQQAPDDDGDFETGGAVPFRPLRDPAVQESTRDLYYLAMDAIDRLSEAGRAVDQATADTVRGHSPDRLVTVAVEGGRVVAVDFDQSWLAQAAAVEITQRLRAAFDAVDQAGPRSAAAKALDNSSIRELQQVSADPGELLRRLGLG